MAAPTIQYDKLPAEQQKSNPRNYLTADLERNQNYIKKQYDTQWELLRKTSRNGKQFKQGVDELIANTDAQLQKIQYRHQQKISMLDQIEDLTNQGFISPDVGQRAAWETGGFKMPKKQDWRTEHGKIITEINRVQDALNAIESKTGRAMFPRKDTKWGPGKEMEYSWDKMSPEKAQQLEQLLNAKDVLLQQERSIYDKLPQLEKKATALQTASFRRERNKKWAMSKFTNWRVGSPPKWFMQGYDTKPVGFNAKIVADMPYAKQPQVKKLTKDIAKQYLIKYGNMQAAKEAAEQDGYSE